MFHTKSINVKTTSCSLDRFNSTPALYTDGWGNKLVTIFAQYCDHFIITQNLSLNFQISDFRLWTNPFTLSSLLLIKWVLLRSGRTLRYLKIEGMLLKKKQKENSLSLNQ